MNFEHNLFISYTHIDNQPLTDGEKGWITRFHLTLKALLSMRLGRDATIWRDEKLCGNDVFSDEIVARFKQSAVLVSIVSSRYLNSEWCTREAREFCQSALQTGGLVVGNKSRVFKIIKTPVDTQESLPAPMKELLGYDFFTIKDGVPLEFDPAYGQEYAQLYNQNVAKLAREFLDGELKRLGYPVLPDRQLPADEAEYVAAVESMLARCALSIHLVGESYGAVPDGPTAKSTGMLQNELAVEIGSGIRCCRGKHAGTLRALDSSRR